MPKVVDQFSDSSFKTLYSILNTNPAIEPLVKTASIDDDVNTKRASSAFAWQEERLFPIDSPEQAALSWAYMCKQASVPEAVRQRCQKALDIFGIEMPIEKVADAPKDTSSYLLPQHERFLVKTAEDVKMADETINMNYRKMDVTTRSTAATNLVKKALALNVPVSMNILKFAGATQSDTLKLRDWLEVRSSLSPDIHTKLGYEKLSMLVLGLAPLSSDRDALVKVATVIHELDKVSGIDQMYGRKLPDAMNTVFNTDKMAEEQLMLAGRPVNIETLLSIAPETYQDVFGADITQDFVTPTGEIDAAKLTALLPTVPYDLQKVLATQLAI